MASSRAASGALHVVGAAAAEPVAVDPGLELLGAARHDVDVAVEEDRGRAPCGPTAAVVTGRPRIPIWLDSTSRESSQPLTNPAHCRIPSSEEVS